MDIQYTDYQVAIGSIQIPSTKRASFTGHFLRPGDAIPEDMISDKELASLLSAGIICVIPDGEEDLAEQVASKHLASQWVLSPEQLVSKGLEDLLCMIVEIDPLYDIGDMDEESARALLSRDHEPEFDSDPAKAIDLNPVARMGAEGVAGSGNIAMSESAQGSLQMLQERAGTADAAGDPDGEDSDENAE